jgi:hypothetical protein
VDLNLCSLKGTLHLLKMQFDLFSLLREALYLGTDIVQKMSTEIELNCSFDCLGFIRGAMVPCIMLVLGGNLVGGEFCYQNFHPLEAFHYLHVPSLASSNWTSTSMTAGHQQFVTIHYKTSCLLRGDVKRLISLALGLLQSKEVMHVPPRSESLNSGIEMQDLEVHSWAYGQQLQLHSQDCFCCHH